MAGYLFGIPQFAGPLVPGALFQGVFRRIYWVRPAATIGRVYRLGFSIPWAEDNHRCGAGRVAGSVTVMGSPASRRVVVLKYPALRPLFSGKSDAVTGEFTFGPIPLCYKVAAIGIDDESRLNAVIQSQFYPVKVKG